ncbi:MAG: ABC transporter permease [Gemmatimonadota bacterium]
MTTFLHDLRIAARSLRRAPGLAAAVVVTLALGIGATTATFGAVHELLLRPLPYPAPDRLMAVWTRWEGSPRSQLSPAEFLDFRESVAAFEELAVYTDVPLALTGSGEPQVLKGAVVSSSLFPALGVEAALGRTFTQEENLPDRDAVAVLSDGLWRRRFGASPDVIGRRIQLEGEPHTIVGVMPPGFSLPEEVVSGEPTELYVPLGLDPAQVTNRGSHFLQGLARLKPGVTPAAGAAALAARAERSVGEFPDDYPPTMRFEALATPLREDVVGDLRPALLILLGAVLVVLLIACANVAGLLLARGEERQREIAVRSALGASRAALARQPVAESLLLGLAGGLLGLLIATWGTSALSAVRPDGLPRMPGAPVSLPLLAFALALSALTGIACGFAPVAGVARRDLDRTLRGGGRADVSGGGRQPVRAGLVLAQLALALLLLVSAGLLTRSFSRLLAVDPGYATTGLLTVAVSLPSAAYAEASRVRGFFRETRERVAALPGVRAAGWVTNLPLASSLGDLNFHVEGRPEPGGDSPDADWQAVTPGYFEAMRMRVLRGRGILPTDDERAPGVVVISRSLARLYWPGEEALGKRFVLGGGAGPGLVTVVGVVADVRHAELASEARPQMYLPQAQFLFWNGGGPVSSMTLVVRSEGEPAALAPAVARELRGLDSNLPLGEFLTMEQVRAASVAAPRFAMLLLGAFSAVALALAGVGVYGLVSHATGRRTREVGLRLAHGAGPGDVLRLLVGGALRLAAIGVGVGLAAALVSTRVLAGMLYGVSPTDPVTFLGIPALLLAVALFASWLPARRVLRGDPMAALRQE